MSGASDQLAMARLQVARTRPYYSSVLWALQPVPVQGFAKMSPGPIGVDQHLRLYYDPDVIGTFEPQQLAATLVHEIGHVLRAHDRRRGGRDAIGVSTTGTMVSIWNIAGDLEINDDLAAEGLRLGDQACYPKNFKDKDGNRFPDGLMAEEYYEMLLDEMSQRPSFKLAGQGAAGGQCGSVAHGKPEDHEEPASGTDTTPAGVSHAEAELLRQRVAQDVENHAKTRGTVPAWLERWAKERLKSKVDWRRMLRAMVRSAVGEARGMVDYSYQRPGRRSGSQPDFIWPTMRQPVPHVAVVVDTSGSMSEVELAQALAEIEGVLTALGQQSVTVLAVDAAVHTTQKVFKAQDVRLMGGGGTSMTVGLRAAEALKPRPHVIVLVTDCETDWPDQPLKMPLIVARTSTTSPVPDWARSVDVVPEPAKAK